MSDNRKTNQPRARRSNAPQPRQRSAQGGTPSSTKRYRDEEYEQYRRSDRYQARAAEQRRSQCRTTAPAKTPAKQKTSPLFIIGILVVIALAIALVVGLFNAFTGGSSEGSASVSASAPASVAASETVTDGYRDNSKAKQTAAGNTAVARVRTEEERKATSDSDNSVTPVPKTVYLTFDDGPSPNTHNILKVLDEYGIKATWFVKANQPELEYVKDIWAAGNQVAIHTYSHDYTGIYANTDAFWNDLETAGGLIEDYLGFVPCLTRFPGGSNNSYNGAINGELKSGLASRGYHYFDWNISSGDGGDHDADFIVNYILDSRDDGGQNALGCHSICLLMHDSSAKDTTVEALPRLIEAFIDEGFEFDVLLSDSYGYRF